MTMFVRLTFPQAADEIPLSAATPETALEEATDRLSVIAAEGRLLPTKATILETVGDDTTSLRLSGTLAPRKGCCGGWEVTWHNAVTQDEVATFSL